MDGANRRRPNFNEFKAESRKLLRLLPEALIKTSCLDPEKEIPLVMEPQVPRVNLVAWAERNRELIEGALLERGAVLFRGFKIDETSQFEQLVRAVSGELLDYRERAAPRQEVTPRIYTSTEFPADQSIPLHHEMAYCHHWPSKIWFFCLQVAQQGGETPIANGRAVINLIDPKIRERFMEKGVMYLRNYGEGLDMSWQVAFQTDDRSAVEEYCRQAHIQFEWRAGNRLRTRQIRQATVRHPKTGEVIWFNHAHLFHPSNLPAEVRSALLAEFKDTEIPRNAFYGDGSRIEASVLDEIRDAYQRSAVVFPWKAGDVLLLDNFLISHGRTPFVGPRKILVAMAELST